MANPLRPKVRLLSRLLPAIGLSLAVALVLGTMVGAAVAGSDAAAEDPASVRIPAARMGDRATYDLTLWGDWLYQDKPEGQPFTFLSFEWGGVETIRDAQGRTHPTEMVRTSGLSYTPHNVDFGSGSGAGWKQGPAWLHDNETGWFEPAQPRLVALGGQVTETVNGTLASLNGIPLLPGRTDYNVTLHSFTGQTLCLQAPSVQGTAVPTTGTVDLAGCSLAQLMQGHGDLQFQATGFEEVNGLRALRLEAMEGEDAITYWFADGIPYPVRLEMTGTTYISWESDEGRGTFRLDLAGLDVGAEARQDRGGPGALPPAMATAPRKPWGMDEAGVTTPFPASLAFEKAKENDPEFAALAKASPDAYLSKAWYLGSYSGAHAQVTMWWLELTDGKTAVPLVIEQQIPWPAWWVGGGRAPDALAAAATYEVYPFGSHESSAPAPAALPKEWPTVEAALQRWSLYSGKDASEGPGWGHRVHCATDDCAEATILIEAGRRVFDASLVGVRPDPANPVQVAPFDYAFGELTMTLDGEALLFIDSEMTQAVSPVAAASASPASAADEEPADAPAALDLRIAGVLPAPQAAGVGLLAIASGVLYWLWPALKSGGFLGLFSRLRTDRLLEHPQRARLADLVAAEPGIHFQELGRRSGLANGTLTHHLQKLVDGGHVVAHKSGRYTCYFPRAASPGQRAAAGTTKSEGARAILAAIQARPGATMQEIALSCGLQASTVTYHVQRLSDAGLVTANRDGKYQRLVAVAAA
jgi:DNA-binding transcriptional ArsR family regulator